MQCVVNFGSYRSSLTPLLREVHIECQPFSRKSHLAVKDTN